MAALKRMQPRNRGEIVQVGSALAYRSIPLQSAYCGAKSAIRGFTGSIRCELLHDNSNVHITMVQMPAVNTPQFGWIKTSMPHQPQPVPPIFQPEVAAEAIVWAAHHQRRELYVGGSTIEAILGTTIVPGLLDRYLAKTGYSSQQTDQPVAPDRPSNLWEPVSQGNYSAHGQFNAPAKDGSLELWIAKNLDWLTLAVGAGVAGVAIGTVLSYHAQQKTSTVLEDDDQISEFDVRTEVLRQVGQAKESDRFHLLMGLASLAWKAFNGKPNSEQPPTYRLSTEQLKADG
jgi:hypothetical protein